MKLPHNPPCFSPILEVDDAAECGSFSDCGLCPAQNCLFFLRTFRSDLAVEVAILGGSIHDYMTQLDCMLVPEERPAVGFGFLEEGLVGVSNARLTQWGVYKKRWESAYSGSSITALHSFSHPPALGLQAIHLMSTGGLGVAATISASRIGTNSSPGEGREGLLLPA